MHLTHSNTSCLDIFGLDESNLTQTNSNSWIQIGPMSHGADRQWQRSCVQTSAAKCIKKQAIYDTYPTAPELSIQIPSFGKKIQIIVAWGVK
jgi:hypothetical protein